MFNTREELLDWLENNVIEYASVEEYGRDTFSDGADYSEEEFEEDKTNGFMEELTLGTYNGATQTTYYRKIDKRHIYDALVEYLKETDFGDVWYLFEGVDETDVTWDELIEEIATMYTIIRIKDRIYLDRN